MAPIMNETKWEELRLAMYGLDHLSPLWRTKDLNGYVSIWDGEWFHHFRLGGYRTIEWIEIQTKTAEQDAAVLTLLQQIHLPGQRIDQGYCVYGYVPDGTSVDYL